MAVRKLTERMVEELAAERGKQQSFFWDKTTPGLGVRVTAGGRRAFVFRWSVAGVERRRTIGGPPDVKLADARVRVAELRGDLDRGEDPALEIAARDERTLGDLWRKFRDEFLPRRSRGHARNCRIAFETLILPALGADTPLTSLTWEAIDRWHQSCREERPVAGDRALGALRKALNEARKWDPAFGWPGRAWVNPAAEHEMHGTGEPGRAFTDAELAKIGEAIEQEEDPVQRAALHVYLISGLRPDEVCRMRWQDAGENGRLDLPDSKTGARVAVLSTRAERIIAKLPHVGDYVFPGRNAGEPLGGAHAIEHGLRPAWERARARVGARLRLYDARHTWISTASALGIGDDLCRLLAGHAKANGAHGKYLHVLPEHRRAANRVADTIARKLELA